jgi:uncharacterized protein with PQ loop repeat
MDKLTRHHQNIRKHVKLQKYPNPNKQINFVDRLIYLAAIIGPIMTLPQVYTIWVLKITAGVSALAWATYGLLSLIYVWYGIIHKEKPIIFGSLIWVILDILIVVGVLIS